jgi:branched-chain amino acid transport system ATP-binding protein
MPILEARGVHKRFGQQVVLEDVTLAFEADRLSGIMGPNGAGKTTFFHVLTGHHRPDRGHVLFDGTDITGWSPRAIAARGMVRSFQAMTLFDDFTALRNVLTAMPEVRQRGFDMLADLEGSRGTVTAALGILARVGLRERASTVARNLPYGDRRRLDIAIAIAARPKVLFLDEPTAGLSGDAVARLGDLIRELKRSLTIVLIEHNMPFLFGLADSVAVMHWGQVIAHGTPAELREDPWVKASNLGKLA